MSCECCRFLLHQEIHRTFIQVCIKDYAGIDGRRDDLEVNYVAFGSNDIHWTALTKFEVNMADVSNAASEIALTVMFTSYSTAQTFETYYPLTFCEVFLEFFFEGKLVVRKDNRLSVWRGKSKRILGYKEAVKPTALYFTFQHCQQPLTYHLSHGRIMLSVESMLLVICNGIIR